MITAEMVKELRTLTGAGMMECKNALVETGGDKEKAINLLREKGLSKASKKSERTAVEGIIDSYIHLGGKIGVLIEVNCETDFVAKNEDFKSFVRDLCLQIAAANPSYISREEVPSEIVENEKEILRKQALREGKPENIVEKIVTGKLEKFYQDNCLLEQLFVKDQEITIGELLREKVAKIGENIVIRRFTRYEVGATHSQEQENE